MAKARGKKKGGAGRTARPAKQRRRRAAKGRTGAVKPKRKVKAGAETLRLRQELEQWKQLHSQLQEQVRVKESTISMQMHEIMQLKKTLEDLRSRPQL